MPGFANISRRRALFSGLASAGLAGAGPVAAYTQTARTIYYNQGNGLAAESTFAFKVLQLALSKCGRAYDLKPSPLGRVTEIRAKEAMAAGEKMDVAMLGASAKVDAQLQPVRIPIDRGLLGYRIFLIDAARQGEFARIRSLEDLARLSALQGRGWPDIEIMRHAGLTVWTGSFRRLFPMMAAGRADYFPRGAAEAHSERAKHFNVAPNLAVEQTLALHYKFTSLFYVAKGNRSLHDDLYRGFARAYADGSYMRLFRADPDMRAALTVARLPQRRIIHIDNPFLSPQTRAIDARYWHQA